MLHKDASYKINLTQHESVSHVNVYNFIECFLLREDVNRCWKMIIEKLLRASFKL
ncbi:hypothethical protein [Staphylococcus caprae]|uniref:Hypothethical protein n=1 Tax=Staphylococcus caprae TaxID=29380 RepID=A0ABN5W4F1_9STAP|nr:hypothethical protein [Staphylococcus caprae]